MTKLFRIEKMLKVYLTQGGEFQNYLLSVGDDAAEKFNIETKYLKQQNKKMEILLGSKRRKLQRRYLRIFFRSNMP